MAKQKKEAVEKPIEVALWDAANKLRGSVETKLLLILLFTFSSEISANINEGSRKYSIKAILIT